MLVTLVLVASVIGLVWQALWFSAQTERRLADARGPQAERQLEQARLRLLLASLATVNREDPRRFEGTAEHLQGWFPAEATEPAGGARWLRLRIVREGDGSRLELVGEDASANPRPVPLARLAGPARWQYRHRDGRWLDQWPPEPVDAAERQIADLLALPRAIRLEVEQDLDLMVSIAASQNPMIGRAGVSP